MTVADGAAFRLGQMIADVGVTVILVAGAFAFFFAVTRGGRK